MKLIDRILNWMNPPASNPKHVFNCRDLAWVTPIKHWRYTPDVLYPFI